MAERRLDPDRQIALQQLPSRFRPAFKALWDLDLAFGDVISTSTDPHLGAIRLAWWRERLDELDSGGQPPAEPRLQAVAAKLLPRGVKAPELSALEDAWLPLLQPFPWGSEQAEGLKLRGRILFGAAARMLGGDPGDAETAGALWSLVDGANHCSDIASRERLLAEARAVSRGLPRGSPATLRLLTVLAALAASDLKGSGGLGRGVAALTHRILGSFPR